MNTKRTASPRAVRSASSRRGRRLLGLGVLSLSLVGLAPNDRAFAQVVRFHKFDTTADCERSAKRLNHDAREAGAGSRYHCEGRVLYGTE